MSSIKLLKEHDGKAPGAVISVPHGVGRQLITAGIGEWYDSTKQGQPPAAQSQQSAPPAAHESARAARPQATHAETKGEPKPPEAGSPADVERTLGRDFPPQPQPQPGAPLSPPNPAHGNKPKGK